MHARPYTKGTDLGWTFLYFGGIERNDGVRR
jgi:hypothetical protein